MRVESAVIGTSREARSNATGAKSAGTFKGRCDRKEESRLGGAPRRTDRGHERDAAGTGPTCERLI